MFARRLFQRASSIPVMQQTVRRMGGHHKPVERTGLDKLVRTYLVEDEHAVLGVAGLYVVIILTVKLAFGGKKKEVAAPAPAAVVVPSGSIPSADSAEFDAWIATPGNFEKLFQE